jgi:hypothetical protein
MQSSTWSSAIGRDHRVLIVVNEVETKLDEIVATLAAVEQSSGLDFAAAIVPTPMRSWFVRQGLRAARVVGPQLHGVEVEFPYFLESPFAIQWAVQQQCDYLTGTQPYLPLNEEVKAAFEQRMAAMVGRGRYVAHTLPDERLFLFAPDELWRRASRRTALDAHAERQQRVLSQTHRRWVDLGRPSAPTYVPEVAQAVAALAPAAATDADQNVAAFQAAIPTLRRVTEALSDLSSALTAPLIRVAPPGASPAAGWIPPHVEAIWESHYVAPALRWEGPRLAMRGLAAGAYSYLFISAEEDLRRGDAAVAAGRVYRGGVTIGLLRHGEWVNRVDVDHPGPFVVMVVAQEAGDYQLGIANCLRGTELRTAFALRRFGWTRRER